MPETILSSVLLPEPFRPMRPRLSPRPSSHVTPSRTCSRSLGRRRKRSSACSRTVSLLLEGITKLLDTPFSSMTGAMSELLRDTGRARIVDQRTGDEDQDALGEQQKVRPHRRHATVKQYAPDEQDDRRRRPDVEPHVQPLGENADGI